ncbi:MAG: hypothetical protein KY456_15165 [Chloroflexi bacterium]|nr:hypothetical protein [Chloroflexota bacterium]
MAERDRVGLNVRAILVSFRSAYRSLSKAAARDDGALQIKDARDRALALLDTVAVEIDAEEDPSLARVLSDAREEVESLE